MAAPMDRLSSRMFDLESKLAEFESFPSLFSSSASDLGCPSLTTSNTLSSSEGLTELETDVESPTHSPFIGTAYDFTCELLDPLENLRLLGDADLVTPRPLCIDRKGYFPQVGKAEDDGYESEGEAKAARNHWQATIRRHRTVKERKTRIFADVGLIDYASESLAVPITNDEAPSPSTSPASESATGSNELISSTENPTRVDTLVPGAFMQPAKVEDQRVGLGLGLPTTRNRKLMPRAKASWVKATLSASPQSFDYASEGLVDTVQLPSPMSCKKVTLRPIDAVLEFVQTPSPIEMLPSPILSVESHESHWQARAGMDRNQSYFVGSGGPVGLGLSVDPDNESI